jgi:parallel beta-helix repeat protein
MGKKYGTLVICAAILVLCFTGTASAETWYVDDDGGADFTRIQDAINKASDGDRIIVYSGIYYENVVVNKSVTLMGNGQPVIDAGGEGNAITLTEDGITLVGFNATNSGSSAKDAGIRVSSNNNTITGNNASNNNEEGIRLGGSNNNTITGNNVRNNKDEGIELESSCNNNIITGNNVSNNNKGIRLSHSSNNNTITGNNVNNNFHGIDLSLSSNNNTITGNNVSNNTFEGIHLFHSSNNNTITGNNVNNNWDGIHLFSSCNNNTITGNNVSNNRCGIHLFSSSNNNTITGNNVSNNRCGIDLYDSSNNNIYPNNFINNTDNVCSYEPTPKRTPTPPSTTTNLPPPVIMPIGSWENPQVEIENHAHLSITVTFTGPTSATIYLPPGATKTHQFSPGKYSIYATAPGVIPFSGSDQACLLTGMWNWRRLCLK